MNPSPKLRGQMTLMALLFMALFIAVGVAIINYITTYARAERYLVAAAQALQLAEAGMDNAAYQLNQNSSYTGESNTALGNGVFTISVTPVDSSTKRVTATGYVPNSSSPRATKAIKAKIATNPDVISFHYGSSRGRADSKCKTARA